MFNTEYIGLFLICFTSVAPLSF